MGKDLRVIVQHFIVGMIESYMEYYNNRRLQRNLGVLTPMEKHEQYILAA